MKTLLTITFFALSLPAFATTAILCGPAAQVDADNNSASVWIVMDRENPSTPSEVSVTYKGKDATVIRVLKSSQSIAIRTTKPDSLVTINNSDISSMNCEGDDRTFTIRHKPNLNMSDRIVSQCRCFAD